MEKNTSISLSNDEVILLTKKLASFKESLDKNESQVLDLILSKAGEINPSQVATKPSKTNALDILNKNEQNLLAQLTKAIDGKANKIDVGWLFSWTYTF